MLLHHLRCSKPRQMWRTQEETNQEALQREELTKNYKDASGCDIHTWRAPTGPVELNLQSIPNTSRIRSVNSRKARALLNLRYWRRSHIYEDHITSVQNCARSLSAGVKYQGRRFSLDAIRVITRSERFHFTHKRFQNNQKHSRGICLSGGYGFHFAPRLAVHDTSALWALRGPTRTWLGRRPRLINP